MLIVGRLQSLPIDEVLSLSYFLLLNVEQLRGNIFNWLPLVDITHNKGLSAFYLYLRWNCMVAFLFILAMV